MKKNIIYAAGIWLVAAMPIAAENNTTENDSVFERKVTVEREYTPLIKEATKLDGKAQVKTSQAVQREVVYTDFNRPIKAEKSIPTLEYPQLAFNTPQSENGFARLGLGMYWNTLADLHYQLLNEKDMKMGVYAHHYGAFGYKTLSETDFGIDFRKLFNTSEIYVNLSAANSFYNRYGKAYVDSTSTYDWKQFPPSEMETASIWDAEAVVGWRSTANSQLDYLLQTGYEHFNLGNQTGTHTIKTKGAIGGTVGNGHKIGLEADMDNIFYMAPYDIHTTTFIHALPYYSYTNDVVQVQAGVNIDMLITDQFKIAPSPDVRFEWKANPDMVSMYLNATGSYTYNKAEIWLNDNRYMDLNQVLADTVATYSPIQAEFGLKIKPANGLLINPFIAYSCIKNERFYYYNTTADRFQVLHQNASTINAGLNLDYHFQDKVWLNLGGAYHLWIMKEGETAWDRPAWNVWTDIRYNITTKWSVQLDATLTGDKKALVATADANNQMLFETRQLDMGYNINVGCIYTPNKWLSAFVKVNNIAHNKYATYYAYESYGIQFLVGASVAF